MLLLIQTLRISTGVKNLRKKQYQFSAICLTAKLKPAFFEDPSDSNYGASPHALAASIFFNFGSQDKTSKNARATYITGTAATGGWILSKI